ncbi:ABC transporter ATP-binding protein [Streptomyces sp. WAC8370]|uniref:ABC transporter ATP-binding protein n=1 Tax=Streptomyces sp. WAC8370 TaxID=3351348 RepID=UPI003F7AFE17
MRLRRSRRQNDGHRPETDHRPGKPDTTAATTARTPAVPTTAPTPAVPTTAPAPGPAVELRGVRRRYGRGAGTVHALSGIDLALPHGTFTAVMGPSGSGKSTFLQCAAGLDRPSAGSVRLGGTEITGMSENELTELRRGRLGFVFQAFNLLPSLTVEQNVLLPVRLAGQRQDHGRAAEVLARVGLADKARRRPGELSGGQQQRVAVARALVTAPGGPEPRRVAVPRGPGRGGGPRPAAGAGPPGAPGSPPLTPYAAPPPAAPGGRGGWGARS